MGPQIITTLGISGLTPATLKSCALVVGAPPVAIDMRPKASDHSVEWVGRYLRWGGRVERTLYLPELHDWQAQPKNLHKLVATARKYGDVMLLCSCEAADCTRDALAERVCYFVEGAEHLSIDAVYRPPREPDLPKSGMAPDEVNAYLRERDETERRMASATLISLREQIITDMQRGQRYTVTCIAPTTLRKRTVSGTYTGRSESKLLLTDGAGRLNRLPIDRIATIIGDPEPLAALDEVAA